MPNTFTMQELARMSLDEHLENLESGRSFGEPVVYSVRKGRPELAWWFTLLLTAFRYPYPQRSRTTEDGYITVFSSTIEPYVFKRYEGQSTPLVALADKIFAQRWTACWKISIPAMPKLIPLGDGSNLTTLKKPLQITRNQLGWIFELARRRLAGKEQGWRQTIKGPPGGFLLKGGSGGKSSASAYRSGPNRSIIRGRVKKHRIVVEQSQSSIYSAGNISGAPQAENVLPVPQTQRSSP